MFNYDEPRGNTSNMQKWKNTQSPFLQICLPMVTSDCEGFETSVDYFLYSFTFFSFYLQMFFILFLPSFLAVSVFLSFYSSFFISPLFFPIFIFHFLSSFFFHSSLVYLLIPFILLFPTFLTVDYIILLFR